jgi:hypothetical protein
MWTRRQFVSRGVLGLLGAGGVCLAMPGDSPPPGNAGESQEALPDGSASRDMITPRTDQAIDRGLAFLAARRNRDGSFGTGGYTGNVAITSLGALAFMAAGDQPNRGPYGRIVTDAVRFVMRQENPPPGGKPGFLHNPNGSPHGPMYGHGFGTMLLAEVVGMVNDPGLRDEVFAKLHRAVALIIHSQNPEGGWRYDPDGREADISVTICQIMALRAARNAGVAVPKAVVDKCVQYVMDCQDRRFGYFRYQKQGGGSGTSEAFARTAAGVVALYSAGYYLNTDTEAIKDPVERRRAEQAVAGIKLGLDFMRRNRPPSGPINRLDMHYFYGHYYATQAMWAAGGDYWKEWYPSIREELVGRQLAEGCWADGICVHYATAMACIILQVPNNYLPILQR